MKARTGEANMWHWLFELAYNHELGGALLESGTWTSARLSATCVFAVIVAPMLGVSIEKSTFCSCKSDVEEVYRCPRR